VNLVRLIPVLLSLLVLGAHFLRTGAWLPVAACLGLCLLLLVRRPWVARMVQVVLVLAAAEWLRTLWGFASFRRAHGLPWTRMALILGGVSLFTLLSALVFRSSGLRERYRLRRD
jgi:hypothetical protein